MSLMYAAERFSLGEVFILSEQYDVGCNVESAAWKVRTERIWVLLTAALVSRLTSTSPLSTATLVRFIAALASRAREILARMSGLIGEVGHYVHRADYVPCSPGCSWSGCCLVPALAGRSCRSRFMSLSQRFASLSR
jgi:hypothetical protein